MAATTTKTWRIPRKLPPCWWLALTYDDGRVEWHGPHASRAIAEQDWIHEAVKEWLKPPKRIDVVPEDPASCMPKVLYSGGQASITARWNWFRRHRRKHYIQHSTRREMARKHPNLEWHWIANWVDDRIMLGDGGVLHIIAGRDRSARAWRWHCAWDCY